MSPQERDTLACFRQDYLDLLEGRVAKILQYVAADQVVTADRLEPAHIALISLESSSAMVGADTLVAAIKKLRTAVAEGRTSAFQPLLQQLDREVAAVRTALKG
jgi:hypothetical protein